MQLWTSMFLWCLVVVLVVVSMSGPGLVEAEDGFITKKSQPVQLRQKREWTWNSVYVEEEKPARVPYKIGRLKSTLRGVEVEKFTIEGEGANTIFTVDSSGDLFVTRSLDREEKSVYHLRAKMYDGNNQLVEDTGNFEVIVNDINDNTPVFPGELYGSVKERSPVGTVIMEVKATDADDPLTPNGDLRYTLTDNQDGIFQIDAISGMLSVRKANLDRENTGLYKLWVQARDMGGRDSGKTASASVKIWITDINDNIASFTQHHYEVTVAENHKLNEKITILDLEDLDQIQNKVPRFTISGNYSQMFKVETNSNKDGNLMLIQPLDFETMPVHTFTVEVRDDLVVRTPGNARFAITTATVTIKVLDMDDPPEFHQPNYTFTVMEERMVQNIGMIVAADPDKAKNTIRYSILDQDCPFSINPRTGVLSTVRPLDRELEATHTFQVKAQENSNGLKSLVRVDIIVQDINDNKPELITEGMSVQGTNGANRVLGTLTATDKDEQPASFSFSLASPSSNLSIKDHGNNTAEIVMNQGSFSLDDSQDYSVAVRVSDGGSPPLTSVTRVAIKVHLCTMVETMDGDGINEAVTESP